MKKTIKNKILIPLIVLFTLSIALVGLLSFAPKSVEASFVGSNTDVRVGLGEDTNNGMRFTSLLSKDNEDLVSYQNANYEITYGTFIMPSYYAERKGVGLTEESLFGPNPSFIFDQEEDENLDVNARPWKIINAVCPSPALDSDGNYVINASINMNITKNLNTKYTSLAYFKAVKGEDVKYVLATESGVEKSLLDVVVNAYDAWIEDELYINVFDAFIDDYTTTYPEKANVSYTIVHKYSGSQEVEAYSDTIKLGSDLSSIVAQYDEPIADTAISLQRDYRYYYNDGKALGSLRAKPDGTTKIVIDFASKKTYSNKSNPTPLALSKFNNDMTGNEPYADSYEVEVKNGEEVRVATIARSDIEGLAKGTSTRIQCFSLTEPVVYEAYVKVYTAFIGSKAELEKIHLLPDDNDSNRYAQGDQFLLTTDIDMTGYARGWNYGATGWPGSGYYDRGFRGIFDGNGHVLYNLSTRLFDILGVHSQVNNLTIIGTGLKKVDNTSIALLGRAMYGQMNNCHIDVTVPSGVNSTGTNYTPSILFDHVHKQANYIPAFNKVVIRVDNSVGLDAAVLGNGTDTIFTNTYIYTNAENVFRPGEDANAKAPSINSLNADFTSDSEVREVFANNGWTLESKLPALNGRVVSHGETSYSQYKLNDDNNGRVSNGDKVVALDGVDYVIEESKLLAQAVGKATQLSTNGGNFGLITVDKVTALISSQRDLQYFFYLAGGATPTEVAVQGGFTGYKYGEGELYVVTENIDMSGVTPTLGCSISTTGTWHVAGFHGTLEGNGHAVTNLNKPLIAGLGGNGIVKNLSFVSDNVSEASFVSITFGTVDNCYFDYTTTTATTNLVADYGYGSQWNNCVFKINSLDVLSSNNSTNYETIWLCNALQKWHMNNTIVMTNASAYYHTLGNEGIGVAPTVIGIDGLNDTIASNFLAGANTDVWTDDLTFRNFTILEDYKAWSKYNYGNEDCTSRVANADGFSEDGIVIDNATLSNMYEGSLYLADTNYTTSSYSRTMVRIATIVAKTPKQLANLIYACGSSAGAQGRFGGYVVVGNDLDMTGVSFSIAQNAWSGHHYDDRAFDGVLDGNGYTIYNNNSVMFLNLGGVFGAIVKNLKLDSATKPIAGTLGKVTFNNCELDFELSAVGYHGGAQVHGVIADSVCGTKTATINNTTISVLNMIDATTIYIVKDNTDDNAATPGVANLNNVTLLADEANVLVTGFDITSTVTRGEAVKKYYTTPEKLYYGRYAFNQVDGVKDRTTRVINKFDLEGQLSTGDWVKITDMPAKLGITSDTSNANIDPYGSKKQTLTKVRANSGNYYVIDVHGAWAHIVDAADVVYMTTLLGQGWQVAQSAVQTFGFNANIDMAGVTSIDYKHSSSGESHDWGWKGQIFGNNKTIYNLNVPLVGYTNAACKIQDLTFKNMGQNGCLTQKSSGGNFNNLTFDFDATGMSIKVLLSESNNNRGSSTEAIFTDLTVKVTGATSSFVCAVCRAPNTTYTPGAVRVNNATVTMNDGKFSIGRLDVSSWTKTQLTSGPVTNKVVSGVFNADNTFTNTTVE